jgi:hypothetical protein
MAQGTPGMRLLPRKAVPFATLLGVLLGVGVVTPTSPHLLSREAATFAFSALWVGLILLAAFSSLCLLLSLSKSLQRSHPSFLLRIRRLGLVLGLVFLTVIAFVFLYDRAYEPLKFRWLIHRVESAKTPQEERKAFELAARWGDVWEVNRIQRSEWLPERAQHLQGLWVLELEWLETSGWTGQPYRAYRVVLDETNLQLLHRR